MGKLAEIHAQVTAKKKAKFLELLCKNVGNVSKAVKGAGVARKTPYDWRESDPDFADKWDAILEAATEEAEQELYRRAVKGLDKPIYQGGKLVGMVREFSDTCLIFMLKARKPNVYNPVQKIAPTTPDGLNGIPFVVSLPESWGSVEVAQEAHATETGDHTEA